MPSSRTGPAPASADRASTASRTGSPSGYHWSYTSARCSPYVSGPQSTFGSLPRRVGSLGPVAPDATAATAALSFDCAAALRPNGAGVGEWGLARAAAAAEGRGRADRAAALAPDDAGRR